MLSEKYGWLPSQIRDERLDDILSYIDIITIKNWISKKQFSKIK